MRRLIFVLALAALATLSAYGQKADSVHTPAANSAERKAILDAVRGGEHVVYTVNFIRVHNGWAWVDTTPLDPKTKRPTAEGGPNLVHFSNGKWAVMDLAKVPDDKNDPMGPEDASPTYIRNLRRTYKGCPADIFPKPAN
jgi:hypothetical protein